MLKGGSAKARLADPSGIARIPSMQSWLWIRFVSIAHPFAASFLDPRHHLVHRVGFGAGHHRACHDACKGRGEGLRTLSAASFALEEAVSKLGENSILLSSFDQGLGARLRRMIRKLISPEAKGLAYEVQFIDPVTKASATESLDFKAFVEETGKKARFLGSLSQRGGASARRIEGMSDEQSYKFLQRNIEELQRALRVLAALEEFFRAQVPGEARARVRSIRPEMTTIKGAVIKANQKKHEYVAQCEELEQMRRLGIADSAP